MKNLFLLIAIMLLEVNCDAQSANPAIKTEQKNESTVGNSMIQFANTAQIGIGLVTVGTFVASIPTFMDTEGKDPEAVKERTKQLTTIGITVGVSGIIVYFASFSHIRNAGKLMNLNNKINLSLNNDGIGISIPIK